MKAWDRVGTKRFLSLWLKADWDIVFESHCFFVSQRIALKCAESVGLGGLFNMTTCKRLTDAQMCLRTSGWDRVYANCMHGIFVGSEIEPATNIGY